MAGLVVVLVAVAAWPWVVEGQVALRTAPLTAARIRDNTTGEDPGGLSSPWAGLELRHKGTNAIESSLAAIFRGVAYGVSTTHPTTPFPTTPTRPPSTTLAPTPLSRPSPPPMPRDDQGSPAWAPPEAAAEVQQKAVTDPRGATLAHRPVQTPYIEPPEVPAGPPDDAEDEVPGVVVADMGGGGGRAGWVRGLGVAWVVHVYCAAGVYSVLGVVALVWAARVGACARLLPRGYYLTLHLLMFLAAFLRCVHLFHDPYGASRRLPPTLAALVHETGWPCLTAALGVVILALVRAWRCPRLLPRRPHAPLALALLTAAHLLTSLAAHLISALLPEHAGPLRAAARAVTAAWGGAVGIGGFLSAWRVGRAAGRQPGQLMVRLSRAPLEGSLPPRHPRMSLVWGCRLAAAASLLQVALAALHMYALVGPHYLTQLPPLYPWRWLAQESICRVLEVLAWVLLAAVSMLRLGGVSGKRVGEARLLAAVTCGRCGSCTSVAGDRVDEVFPAVCQTNQAVRNFTLQAGKAVYQEALAPPPLTRHASTVRVTHKRPSIRKSATLHSATSDIHLLWSHGGSGAPSDASSRPSSMLVNDAGFVRFKMQPEQRPPPVPTALCKSLQDLTVPGEEPGAPRSNNPTGHHHALYANTGAGDTKTSPARTAVSPRYEDPYDNGHLEKMLQSRLQELYGVGGGEAASITDCSSTDALSPQPPVDTDWSKYASTCSSISAANSFDVRMYDDFEVASYYQSPSPASSHVYASLHRPALRGRLARQRTVYEAPPSLHGYEARQAVEQLTALLARPPPLRQDAPPGSDSDPSSSSRSRHDDRPWRHPRRPPLHDLTPDSAVMVDDLHTDEASGDDGDTSSPRLGPPPPRPTGLLTKIVKNNFSMSSGGYSPLSSEDVYQYQQALLRHHHQQGQQVQGEERVRPCGHRSRRAPREDPSSTSPTRAPVHRPHAPTDHPHKPRRGSKGQGVPVVRVEDDPNDMADGTTQTEPRTWPPPSPTSSRPASSLASHSDLPSECVDSEDDVQYRRTHHKDDLQYCPTHHKNDDHYHPTYENDHNYLPTQQDDHNNPTHPKNDHNYPKNDHNYHPTTYDNDSNDPTHIENEHNCHPSQQQDDLHYHPHEDDHHYDHNPSPTHATPPIPVWHSPTRAQPV